MGEASEKDDYDCPCPMTNGTALCSKATVFYLLASKHFWDIIIAINVTITVTSLLLPVFPVVHDADVA